MKTAGSAKTAAALCRLPIAFLTSCSALTGHLVSRDRSLIPSILVSLGVFLLAAGASALNQVQEHRTDALMDRTKDRPLPSRKVSVEKALVFAVILIAAGLLLLSHLETRAPLLLGLLALAWYNGLYTYLKRVTAFASLPGAVVGMLPPAMGWTAANEQLSDPLIWPLCFLLFIWQVPHFWLQFLDHGREYEQAGFPSLKSAFAEAPFARAIFVWICASAVSGLFLPLYGTLRSPLVYALLLVFSAHMIAVSLRVLTSLTKERVLSAFRTINAYILVVMALVALESLFLRVP